MTRTTVEGRTAFVGEASLVSLAACFPGAFEPSTLELVAVRGS
jgi:hypothetical protein